MIAIWGDMWLHPHRRSQARTTKHSLISDPEKLWEVRNVYCCFKLLSFGIICYIVIVSLKKKKKSKVGWGLQFEIGWFRYASLQRRHLSRDLKRGLGNREADTWGRASQAEDRACPKASGERALRGCEEQWGLCGWSRGGEKLVIRLERSRGRGSD